MFKLYNLVLIMESDGSEPGDTKADIQSLNTYILENFCETLYLKTTHCDADEDGNSPTKRNCAHGAQADDIGLGIQYDKHVYKGPKVVKGFTRAGFMLELNDEDEDGWALLNQVKQ